MKHTIRIIISIGLLASMVYPAMAQFQITRSVFGNGGAPAGDANYQLDGTLGQAAIGIVAGPSWQHRIGFWINSALPTAVDDHATLPTIYQLGQNQPNPFNPVTTIRYSIPDAGQVSLRLYDINGRQVRELLNQSHAPGFYEFVLDARGISSGVYFYRLEAGQFSETKKLVLLK